MTVSTSLRSILLVIGALTAGPLIAEREWPFSSPVEVTPPRVKAQERVRNPVDAFILQRLEGQDLSLAPEVSRRTLIRRLSFDLLGVPPTPEEIKAFVESEDEQAYEKLVNRLLADKRYGERWARFWLDLARYADTAGFEGDPDLPWAWRYRDYVIDSLNRDKPYDRFIKEQIAGDEFTEVMGAGELPLPDPEHVVAMTFLRLAPFTEPRGDKTRHEMLSEMTSTVSSVFLGLTVGCAQCHDHKYDQIPTKDFYRMKAFFSTIQIMPPARGDGLQIGGPLPAKFYRGGEEKRIQDKRGALEQELSNLDAERKKFVKALRERLQLIGAAFTVQTEGGELGNNYLYDEMFTGDGKLHVATVNSDGEQWRYFREGAEVSSFKAYVGKNQGHWFGDLDEPRNISLGQFTVGTSKPHENGSFHGKISEILIYQKPLDARARTDLQAYLRAKYHGEGEAAIPPEGLRFWLDAADLDGKLETPNPAPGTRVQQWVDKIGLVSLGQGDEDQQPILDSAGPAGAPSVRFDNDFLLGSLERAKFLQDQEGALVFVYATSQDAEEYCLTVGSEKRQHFSIALSNKRKGGGVFEKLIEDDTSPLITSAERRRYRYFATRADFIKQHFKRLQPLAMSLRHSHGPPYEAGVPTSRIMIRGEYDNPGEVVEPGFLSAITGHQEPAKIRLDPFKRWPTRSRRMALARWIASPENPMTARVMMNRLWYRHFGQGIVVTPSDFGKLSGGPSHRELLDWLALRFVKEKWSLKAMHRLMVTSSTYRQSSRVVDERAATIDPDNRLLWRFNRRRLEAEAVRDSVLAVSGRLNSESYGIPIFPPLPDGVEERVKYSKSKWATDLDEAGRKRSIYIYQQRTLTMPFMQSFDGLVCEDTVPRRRTSVTPLQALAMYNGEFVNEEAAHFATRVRKLAGDDPGARIEHAFLLAFGRVPNADERKDLLPFAETDEKLVGLCRILYNASEFVYVD